MSSIRVNCNRDNIDDFCNVVNDCCNSVIDVNCDNLYEVDDVGYFGETLYRYYVICPRCGNRFFIDDSILSDDIMNIAREKNDMDIYLYKKNVLRSQLINLEYKGKNECKKRILK